MSRLGGSDGGADPRAHLTRERAAAMVVAVLQDAAGEATGGDARLVSWSARVLGGRVRQVPAGRGHGLAVSEDLAEQIAALRAGRRTQPVAGHGLVVLGVGHAEHGARKLLVAEREQCFDHRRGPGSALAILGAPAPDPV